MSSERPPTIDPLAAARWQAAAPALSPWLHEEVARRMEDRLQWIRQAPASWCHWDALRGGLQAHALVSARYPEARCQVFESAAHCEPLVRQALAKPWWSLSRWSAASPQWGLPADASVQMLWANMALHTAADPQALIAQWHRALAVVAVTFSASLLYYVFIINGSLVFADVGVNQPQRYAEMSAQAVVSLQAFCSQAATEQRLQAFLASVIAQAKPA